MGTVMPCYMRTYGSHLDIAFKVVPVAELVEQVLGIMRVWVIAGVRGFIQLKWVRLKRSSSY
jgi:hypothetical protein